MASWQGLSGIRLEDEGIVAKGRSVCVEGDGIIVHFARCLCSCKPVSSDWMSFTPCLKKNVSANIFMIRNPVVLPL